MRKFSVALLKFSLCAVTLILLVTVFLNFGIPIKIEGLKHKKNTSIVLGDSHIKLAINDNLIPNTVNLGNSNEPLFFSYYKLKAILEKDSSIQQVYLGMAYHSISSKYDKSIFGYEAQSVASKYFFILPYDQQVKIIRSNYLKLPGLASETILQGFKTIVYDGTKNPLLGGFHNNFKDVKGDSLVINDRLRYHFYKDNSLSEFSKVNINSLKKLKDLCKDTNTELILLNTPLHPYYKENVPLAYKEKYCSIINELDLRLINFEDLPLQNKDYTPDGDHVTREGAVLTTLELLNYY